MLHKCGNGTLLAGGGGGGQQHTGNSDVDRSTERDSHVCCNQLHIFV